MPDIPNELAEGEELSVSKQWNPMVRAMHRLSEGEPPVAQNEVELYELTAAMEYDATAKQWKALAKPVYRHPVNELYEMDDDALEETIWAPCAEHTADVGSLVPPFDSGDRVFTYTLFAHREILHQGARPSAWNGYLNANQAIPGDGSDDPIAWTQNDIDGSGITHSGTDITLAKAGWYHVDLMIQASPGSGTRISFSPRFRINDTDGPPRDGAIWTAEVDETITSSPKSEDWGHKFKAAAGDVLTVTVENTLGGGIAVTLEGDSDADNPRCHLSIAEIR